MVFAVACKSSKTHNHFLHYPARIDSHVLGCKHSSNITKSLKLLALEHSEEYKKKLIVGNSLK